MKPIEELYHRYRADLFSYLLFLTHDSHLAEDLLSETFMSALLALPRFRGESSVKTWLFGIARNRYLRSCRKKQTLPLLEESLFEENDLADMLFAKGAADRVKELLLELSDQSKKVVSLRMEGYPFAEVAERCDISESAARVCDFRARKKIRDVLEKEGYHDGNFL